MEGIVLICNIDLYCVIAIFNDTDDQGWIQGGGGPGPPLTTKTEALAPKFYKTEAPEWQF